MPRFTRKRGGAPHAAYKTKTASRKLLANRNRPRSRAAATLENYGIVYRKSYVPEKVKPRKTRTRTRATANITEAAPPRMSARAISLAQKRATREAANANAKAKANAAAAAKKAIKAQQAAEAEEEAEMERLREAELYQKVTKNHPVIVPSSLTHPAEHAKAVGNYQRNLAELGNMRRSRAPKARASRSRATAPNLGQLSLGTKLQTINENNNNLAPGTPRYR